jgi:hypothetical protein
MDGGGGDSKDPQLATFGGSLARVAVATSRLDIRPVVSAAESHWNDVIHCRFVQPIVTHRLHYLATTELALPPISLKDLRWVDPASNDTTPLVAVSGSTDATKLGTLHRAATQESTEQLECFVVRTTIPPIQPALVRAVEAGTTGSTVGEWHAAMPAGCGDFCVSGHRD